MKYIILLITVAALAALSSCEKIVAKDITGEMPVLILPTAGGTVTTNPVHFKWEAMEGAEKYHLMVVSPSFNSPQYYVLDTLVTGTDFFYSLDSNSYELKLVGVNAGYRSDTLGPIAFNVSATSGGSGNAVTLLSPGDLDAENASFSNQFTWQSMTGAASYEFTIRTGTNFSTGNIIEVVNNISTSSYTLQDTLNEGTYIWGVKAYLTSGTETGFSTHILYIDKTLPNVALLSTPGHQATVSPGNINFVWNNGSDPGTVHSTVTSILEISDEPSFLSPDTYYVTGNSQTVNITATGLYYWRVTNVDAAGNQAASSLINELNIF